MIDMYKILKFLTELEQNNNKEWYHAHKHERLEAEKEFENLIQELILRIGEFDDSVLPFQPKELTFKMVRDTRFSHDKSPYNPVFRAHISAKGKLPIPVGYYLYIQPLDRTFLGGGLFADMFSQATSLMRDYLSQNSVAFLKIIEESEFQKQFEVKGTKLKNVPKGYDCESPVAEYLKNKSWYLECCKLDKDLLDSEKFITEAVQTFKAMVPFNNYINTALKEFKMPER